MLCFGVGVKDGPSFKISISCWMNGTFDKFKSSWIAVAWLVVVAIVLFLVIMVNLTVFISSGFSAYFNKLPISFESCSSECVSLYLLKFLFQLFTFLVLSSLTLLLYFAIIDSLSLWERLRVSTNC